MAAKKRLPKLTAELFSALGNMPVVRTNEGLDDTDYGAVSMNDGRVTVHPLTSERMTWPTYWHEASHVCLRESGIAELLDDKLEEAICEAFGTYLTGMMLAGMLTVPQKRKPSTK